MMGPRAQNKTRRPPNLFIANPDSGSDESGDEIKPLESSRPPAAHPTLTLITQPPTPAPAPAVPEDQQAVPRMAGRDHPFAAGGQRYRAAAGERERQLSGSPDDLATSTGTAFRDPQWNQPAGSAGPTEPKGRASTSPSEQHDPPGLGEAPRTVSDGSIRTVSRPDRPLPKPSSPPSIPLPQPPLRQRASVSSDPSMPSQLSPAYSSQPPTATSSENRRAVYQGDGSHSPVQASPASSGSQNRPTFQIGVPHHAPSGPGSIGAMSGAPSIKLGNVRLQVTTNSDDFSVVDISGLGSAEAIMEKVFSKLRIRDEDYGSHMMFQTDIGETEHTHPIPPSQLLAMCNTLGDSKGNLKFYVKQVALPQSTATSAIPPPVLDIGGGSGSPAHSVQFTPGAASHRSRGTGSISSTGKQDKTPLKVNRSAHSKQGSYSSTGEQYYTRPEYASPTMLDSEADRAEVVDGDTMLGNPLVGKPSLTRNHRMVSQRHRLPSTGGSRASRSPAEEGRRNLAHQYASSPPSFGGLSSPSMSSASATSFSAGQMVELTVPGKGSDGRDIRRGSVTPTMPVFSESSKSDGPAELPYLMETPHARFLEGSAADPFVDSPPLAMPESSMQQQQFEATQRLYNPPSSAHNDWVLSSPSEPTEADLAVVRRLEDEEREREARQLRQLEEDERLAQVEQRKEHEAYYLAQQRQMETDRLAAEAALQQEREQASAARREIERRERERERIVGRERRERRTQWEAMHQTAPAAPAQDPNPDRMKQWISSVATDPEMDRLQSLAARSAVSNGSPTSPLDPRERFEGGPANAGPGPSSVNYRQTQQQMQRSQAPYANSGSRQTGPPRTGTHPQPGPSSTGFNSVHPFAAQQGRVSPNSASYSTLPVQEADRFRSNAYAGGGPNPPHSGLPDYIRRSASTAPPEQYGTGPAISIPFNGNALGYREDLGRYPSTASGTQAQSRMLSRSSSRQDIVGNRAQDSRTRGEGPSQSTGRVAHPFANPARGVETHADQVLDFPQAVPYAGSHSRGGSEGSLAWLQEWGYLNQRRGNASHAATERSQPMPDMDADGETLWLVPPAPPASSVPRSTRSPTGESSASSVRSQATTRPPAISRNTGNSEDDSGDTARAADWAEKLGKMLGSQNTATDGDATLVTAKPRSKLSSPAIDDGGEETLWFTPPSKLVIPQAKDTDTVVVSPGRPSLRLDTHVRQDAATTASDGQATSLNSSEPPPSTATDSDANEDPGAKVRRHRSFARNKENQWNFRPPAEHVYDNLEEFFPKIDLDKPVVAAADALPHIDEASPGTVSPDGFHEGLQRAPQRVPSSSRQAGFNKADARKSIRVVAEGRKKHLSRIAPAVTARQTPLERKRSSSMWGHKVVEVTPSRLRTGKIPETDETGGHAQTTMTWVKGDLIGKGTYGRVYLALNATTGDMIAVKQVEMPRSERDREDARHASMIEALKGEIALLKDLEHPNVVAYLGWEESTKYLSIFLEYVPGGSIASVYRRHKKFEEGVIQSFTRQILDGLSYLHSLHILHRDLKADNVLVDTNGICKISDFGISKRTDAAYDSIVSTNLKGSVFWMAPEVVHSTDGQGYSAKVDIWSLGCVVLEMWAGRRPWGDMEALAAMFQLANSRKAPPIPDDVTLSPIAADFLNKRCFAPNPHDRPTAAELLAHRFITDVDPSWTFANSGIGRAVVASLKR